MLHILMKENGKRDETLLLWRVIYWDDIIGDESYILMAFTIKSSLFTIWDDLGMLS